MTTTTSSEINSSNSNESISDEIKSDENNSSDKSVELNNIQKQPYVPNNSFSKLKKFTVNIQTQNELESKIEEKTSEHQVVPLLSDPAPPPFTHYPSTVTIIHKKKDKIDANKVIF